MSLTKKRILDLVIASGEMFCFVCITISMLCVLAFFTTEKEERLKKEKESLNDVRP